MLNELRQRQGAGGAQLERVINEAIFPAGHPYRAVDSIDTVAKLELADVCAFLKGPYQRGKAFVIAAGGLANTDLQTAASRHYGKLPNRDLTPIAPPPPIAPTPGTSRLKADVDVPTLLVTWPLPPRASRDYRLLELGWDFIGDRLGAFGFTYGWGQAATIFTLGGDYAPVLAISIELSSADQLDDAIDAANKSVDFAFRSLYRSGEEKRDEAWQDLWQGGVEGLIARWESLGDRDALMADFLQYDADEAFLAGRVDELVKAGPEETRALAEKWLAPGKARFLLLEPASPGSGRRVATYHGGGAEAHGVKADPALADRPLSIPTGSLRINTVRYVADNGLAVILWPFGHMPLTRGRLVVGAGAAHDPAGKEGISDLVGADEVDPDNLVFAGRTLATRVDDLVVRLGLELREPGYELSDDARDVIKGRLRRARVAERRTYTTSFLTALYGEGHPYARPAMTEQSMGQIDTDSIMDWARAHIVPKNSTLIVVGQLDADLVKQHIAYNTDQVSSGERTAPIKVLPHPHADWIAGTSAKSSPTVDLEVGFVGGAGLDEHHAERLVLEAVLDSKLAALRDRAALTYGVYARYEPRKLGGLWLIGGEVDAARAAEGAQALAEVLAEIRKDPESYRAEFVLARQTVLESLLAGAADTDVVADRLVEVARFDLDDDFYDRVARRVAGLVLKDFHPFVAKELAAGGQVFGAFGNADAVKAALRAAGSE